MIGAYLLGRLRRRFGDERGGTLVSFVLLFPVFIFFAELIVLGGRLTSTTSDIQAAARESARQASVAAGQDASAAVIEGAALEALVDTGFRSCENPVVVLGGQTDLRAGGQVQVVVTCRVFLADLGLLNVPGAVFVTRRALEPIDTYRVYD